MGKNHDIIDEFCRGLSLCPCGHTVHRDSITYHVSVSPMPRTLMAAHLC